MTSQSTATTNVTVREAGVEDLSRLTPLFDAYRVFYGQEPAGKQAEAFLRERLTQGDAKLFVAEVDGAVAGFVQLYPMLSSIALRRTWVLNDLYVDEAQRQHGVAAALLERSVAFARETGAARLELSTARDNRAAQALYEKHGWRRDEVFVHYVFAEM